LHKLYNIAAGSAAIAVEVLPILGNRKRRRLFPVERTQAHMNRASFPQFHLPADHIDYITSGFDFIRNIHVFNSDYLFFPSGIFSSRDPRSRSEKQRRVLGNV
jgi:hypothetical protein